MEPARSYCHTLRVVGDAVTGWLVMVKVKRRANKDQEVKCNPQGPLISPAVDVEGQVTPGIMISRSI
jgi:hypothetical protein